MTDVRTVIDANVVWTPEGLREKIFKQTAEGEPLFWLPIPPTEIRQTVTIRVKSTDVSSEPVMVTVSVKEPLKDESGVQKTYIPTTIGEVTTDTGEPVLIENLAGELVQKKDKNGQLLFYGQVPIPGAEPVPCYISVLKEVQEKDNGKLLYWNEVPEDQVSYVPNAPVEITADDERYVESLEKAYTLVALPPIPVPPKVMTAEEKIAQLTTKNNNLQAQLGQLSTDFQSFMMYVLGV